VNNLIFWIILYFFLFTIFSYMLYNSKWFEIFQACSQLALMNESKELPPFWTFFHTNVTLWSAASHFFVRPKKWFLSIQILILCNLLGGNFWNFFHIFSNQRSTRSYDYMCSKMFFSKILVLMLEMAVLEHSWWKHSRKPFKVEQCHQVSKP